MEVNLADNSTNSLNSDDGFLCNSAPSRANGCSRSPELELPSEDQAATTVQRVYRGHRARRKFADDTLMPICKLGPIVDTILVLECSVLCDTSETFYAPEKYDTAVKRWSRLKTKAAKVGKGLSKDEKAQKLAIQHWLEAIDPRHRYGHNLRFYYEVWSKSSTKEPFFYWLDIGDGKEVDLPECKRSKLHEQQIEYLGPNERDAYEVIVQNGKLLFKETKKPVDTPSGEKWIFVMSSLGKLYVAQKKKGNFQHSSFLAGEATKAAGRLIVEDGTLKLMEAHSGHYLPTVENFSSLIEVLKELGTDLSMAHIQNVSDDMLSKMRNELEG